MIVPALGHAVDRVNGQSPGYRLLTAREGHVERPCGRKRDFNRAKASHCLSGHVADTVNFDANVLGDVPPEGHRVAHRDCWEISSERSDRERLSPGEWHGSAILEERRDFGRIE